MFDPIPSVTEEEIQEAIALFYAEFPAWKGLLDEWVYDKTKRFVNKTTGKRVPEATIRGLGDKWLDSLEDYGVDLTESLEEGQDVGEWGSDLAKTVLLLAIVYYLLGRGGLSQMGESDWFSLTNEINDQYDYLSGFADDVAAGALSKAQINARTSLYFASASQRYHQGRANAFGLTLPGYPGVGTDCKMNCKCFWNIKEYADRWECFWMRTAAESCPTCVARSISWNPYILYK